MPTTTPAIRARHLTKTYRFHQQGAGLLGALKSVARRRYETRLAVDRIDFTVQPGEIVGLLGPNGAGKTTTLKMLSGLLHPSSGELSVLGFLPAQRKHAYLRRISLVMGQKSMLWWDVPAMDSLLLHRDMYDISRADFDSAVAELAELLDVADLLSIQVRKTSLGQRMRLELMAALLHRPTVLFLDEPTIGLDVVSKARVRSFLAELNRRYGTTILLSSHDMDDIEALCPRVMIIDHGRIGYDGSLSELVRTVRPQKKVRAVYAEPIADHPATGNGDPRVLTLEVDREHTAELLERLPRLGPLVDLDITDPDIEEIVAELFRGGTR